jgi:Trk-type K+ transport system membrane component
MNSRWLYIPARPKWVAVNLTYMLKLHGFVFLPPALISLLFQEYTYTIIFGAGALLTYFIGTLVYDESYAVANKTESMVIAALSYVLFSCLGALAFLPCASFGNGLFEAMSRYTTTGLTMFQPGCAHRSFRNRDRNDD